MKKLTLALIPLVFCFAAGVEATPITYFAELLGSNESPPNGSPGTGEAVVVYDPDNHTLQISTTFQDLLAGTTAAHIHCCTAIPLQGNIGVATQTPFFVGFPIGVTGGSFFSTYDLTDPASWNAAFITSSGGTPALAEARLALGLTQGRAYFNVHSSQFPAGEIRGFLIPEPGTLGLLAIVLASLAAAARKRQA